MDETALLLALDTCEFLFLTEIGEPEANRQRLVVEEGRGVGKPSRVELGHGRSIDDVRAIEVVPHSQRFELIWDHYISYAVHNESYQSWATPKPGAATCSAATAIRNSLNIWAVPPSLIPVTRAHSRITS